MRKIFVFPFLALFCFVFPVASQIEVEFTVSGANLNSIFNISDFKLSIGLDANATNGPELDDFDTPGSPPPLFSDFDSNVFFAGNEVPLVKDFKLLDDESLIWQVQLEFGDITFSGATDANITFDWQGTGGENPFSVGSDFTEYTVQLFDLVEILLGDDPVDMKAVTSHTFIPKEGNEVRDVFIVLTKQTNTSPITGEDQASALKNTTIEIDVLANDVDVDKDDTLTITSVSSTNATIIDNGGKLSYQSNQAGTETFTYTVSDGTNAVDGTVIVTVGDVVFSRGHDSTFDPTEGLVVTIQVNYSGLDANNDTLILTEEFPRFDDALGFYTIPAESTAGSGVNGLEITADPVANEPDSVTDVSGTGLTVDPDLPTVVFTWSPPLPPNGFIFSYTIVANKDQGSDDDVLLKTISGDIHVNDNPDGPDITTSATPVSCSFHNADTNEDFSLSISEIFRVIRLFRKDFYTIDSSSIDGFAPADVEPSDASGFHDADTNEDWSLSISEIFRVIRLFRKDFYTCDPNSIDGYTPTDTQP